MPVEIVMTALISKLKKNLIQMFKVQISNIFYTLSKIVDIFKVATILIN